MKESIVQISRLLSLEYYKFRSHSTIQVLLVLYVVLFPMYILVGKQFNSLPPPLPNNSIFFNFSTVWDWLGYSGSWLAFFLLGLVAIYIVVNEIDYRTFRQNIITGLSRKEFFLSKLLTITVISLLATLFYLVLALVIGLVHTKENSWAWTWDNSWATSRYFLMCMGYMGFGLVSAFLIRRSGLTVLFYLAYFMMFEPILRWGIHLRFFHNNTINYYPANCLKDIMPLPAYRIAEMIPQKDIEFDFLLSYGQAATGVAVWLILLLSLAYYMYNRRDL